MRGKLENNIRKKGWINRGELKENVENETEKLSTENWQTFVTLMFPFVGCVRINGCSKLGTLCGKYPIILIR